MSKLEHYEERGCDFCGTDGILLRRFELSLYPNSPLHQEESNDGYFYLCEFCSVTTSAVVIHYPQQNREYHSTVKDMARMLHVLMSLPDD